MPNPGADAPLRKVTLNLYEEDCIALERTIGYGWTAEVRNLVHAGVIDHRITITWPGQKRKLGDLDE